MPMLSAIASTTDSSSQVNAPKGLDSMTRSRIGPLALESPLGERGSTLFRAVHIQQKAQVAVRVFSQPMGMTPEAKQEFAQQLDSLKALKHPNIVRCFGGGFDAKDAYLVYELADGESLSAALKRRERLPWEQVLEMGLQLCEALHVAHQAKWTHGRIRPDKIILSPDGAKAKLADFRRGPGAAVPLTAAQLAYSAPETFAENPRSDASSDLYSVGACMYVALTGKSPFEGANPTMMRIAINEQVLAPVATLVFDCPVWLSAIVEQLMNRDSNKRPFSANATAMALREAQRRTSQGISVAEHALSGFSALQLNTNRAEAEKALGRKKSKKKQLLVDSDGNPMAPPGILERPLILLSLLAGAIVLIGYLLLPLSESTLRARAEKLLASDEMGAKNQARDTYLAELLERFPEGKSASWAEEQLKQIEMENAEMRVQNNQRFKRDPKSEGERMYAEAKSFETKGDRIGALELYKSLLNLLQDNKEERAFVNLARRQMDEIEATPITTEEVRKYLEDKLSLADKLMTDKDPKGAKQIWLGIVNTYGTNQIYTKDQDISSLLKQAQEQLFQLKNE
jgi:eukaryotic-like serine/threonine-protein kinase